MSELDALVAAVERIADLLNAKAAPLTYNIEGAAERLGGPFTVDFLKNHLHEIPHIKSGNGRGRAGRIAFSEQHLIQVVDKYTVTPSDAPAPEFPSMRTCRTRRSA